MNVTVVINRFAEIEPRQTTAMLIAALANRGHQVCVAEITGVTLREGRPTRDSLCVTGISVPFPSPESPLATATSVFELIRFSQQPTTQNRIDDVLLIRTSPGRDMDRQDQHRDFLNLAAKAEATGRVVINSPRSLWQMASKESVLELDERYRPASLMTRDPKAILDFVNQWNDCVIKPLMGSRGSGVIRVTSACDQLVKIIQSSATGGELVVQEYVDIGQAGDTRILTLGGSVLELNGHVAAIRRLPAAGEFRANLHAGGTPVPATITEPMRMAVNQAAQLLDSNGVWFAGVDLIGEKVIEFNVFSTGGLFDAERFTGQNFSAEFVLRLEDLVAKR